MAERLPICWHLRCITKERWSALIRGLVVVVYEEEKRRCSYLIQADSARGFSVLSI